MAKHVHDYHDKHSLPMVGLLFMVFIDKWLRMLLGFSTQPILLHFDVIEFYPFCCIRVLRIHMFIPHRLHLFILLLCKF
jgi:hypothetical protein